MQRLQKRVNAVLALPAEAVEVGNGHGQVWGCRGVLS